MTGLDTKRHDTLFSKKAFDVPIHVIGTGGVGSHVTYMLAKLGVGTNPKNKLHLYDGDVVEGHNIANQAFLPHHINKEKVVALAQQFRLLSGGNIATPHAEYVTKKIPLSGVVILCLDSMDTRLSICRESIWNNPDVQLFIDARMDASNAIAYAFDPNNKEHVARWEQEWFPDAQAEHRIGCNGPVSVITAVTMTAALAVQHLISFSVERSTHEIPQYLRFTLGSWDGAIDFWDEVA